jgi:hypothetical protein
MPEIVTDPPSPSCSHLLLEIKSRNIKAVALIPFSLAREGKRAVR